MSCVRIRREWRWASVVIATAVSQSSTIVTADTAGAAVEIAGQSPSVTRLHVYGSHDDKTYRQLHNTNGTTAEIVVDTSTSAIYSLADGVLGNRYRKLSAIGFRYLRLVADAPLGESAICRVSVKS